MPLIYRSKRKPPVDSRMTKIYVGSITESDARPTSVQLKREAKLLTVIGWITKHANCRIIGAVGWCDVKIKVIALIRNFVLNQSV